MARTTQGGPRAGSPADAVGIQVPAGRIHATRARWQTVLVAPDKPSIYRLFNAGARRPSDSANAMMVEIDGSKRLLRVDPGSSIDVMAKRIRVQAGNGGDSDMIEGWYVLVS
jgi:hypothetical protein